MNAKLFPRLASLLLLVTLVFAGAVRAQDATPDSTVEPTVEVTPDATPEITPEPQPSFPGTGSFTVRVPIGDVERRYRITIPKIYAQQTTPTSLIIALHGAGGTGAGTEDFTGFDTLAEKDGFIVIYPDGLNNVWNDGRDSDPRVGHQDDVAFIGDAIDFLLGALKIDPLKVYATGYSMGAMLSYRLACMLPDKIAAIAPVASTMPQYLADDCVGTPPVPLMVTIGTDDPIVPWGGVAGGYYSAADTLAYWKTHNACKTDQGISMQDDTDPTDGTRIIVEGYSGCANGAVVQVNTVFHGGHTWPGHVIQAPFDLGATSMDMDATQAIWDFFQAHPHTSKVTS